MDHIKQDTVNMLNIEMKFVVVFALFFICCCAEEQCSRYHYEEQTLAKVVRLEYRLERLEKKVKNGGKLSHKLTVVF